MSAIAIHRLAGGPAPIDVAWAVPTSGHGHTADEQALPFIAMDGQALTPRFGGESGWPECGPATLGLPWAELDQPWPWSQRLFNLPRRSANLYWRELFKSRTDPGGRVFFWNQLDYMCTETGFQGRAPMAVFERRFSLQPGRVLVEDTIVFRQRLRLRRLVPVTVPLFKDWRVGAAAPRWLEPMGFPAPLRREGSQISAAGHADLWVLCLDNVVTRPGHPLHYRYAYHFE